MPSVLHATACAVVALVAWTAIGLPVTRRFLASTLAWPFAPVAGWALWCTLAIPFFHVVPFDATTIAGSAVVLGIATRLVWRRRSNHVGASVPRVPVLAWVLATTLAIACTNAIVPKVTGDSVALAAQVFDHCKVSMVDEIARMGMPPGNPYIAVDGRPDRLSYYYLWHFGAAAVARVMSASGWEADIAMTFVTLFTSLAAMAALAVHASRRASAATWAVLLASSASARVVLLAVFGAERVDAWLPPPKGFGGWMFQSAWVPQHVAATSCVLLALLLMRRIAMRPGIAPALVLGAVAAAAFESSTWIGGIVFACIAAVVVPWLVVHERSKAVASIGSLALAGATALALAAPFIADQVASASARQAAAPIAVHAIDVVGPTMPDEWRRALDVPAFWLVLLPVELVGVYAAGLVVAARSFGRSSARASDDRALLRTLSIAAVVALLAAWLLRSTLADNNDLGWRAVLTASVLLVVLAAAGVSGWIADKRRVATALALVAFALGLPEAVLTVERNATGRAVAQGRSLAQAPAVWERVRRATADDERVANNPDALWDVTPWPVNIGWALLANRRSCYASWELTQVYSAIPHDRLRAIDRQFVGVFDGRGTADDVRELATVYDCRAAVVTIDDGAWTADPFATSPYYALVDEEPGRFRIYRRREAAIPPS